MKRKTLLKAVVSLTIIVVVGALVGVQRIPWEAGLAVIVAVGAGWGVVAKRGQLAQLLNR